MNALQAGLLSLVVARYSPWTPPRLSQTTFAVIVGLVTFALVTLVLRRR